MTEEQIKKIYEELLKFASGHNKLDKADFLLGARKLNMLYYKQGAITYEEFISLDNMLDAEIDINIILAKS